MTKIAGSGSGSISQRHGYADPDPHQNVMDPGTLILILPDCPGQRPAASSRSSQPRTMSAPPHGTVRYTVWYILVAGPVQGRGPRPPPAPASRAQCPPHLFARPALVPTPRDTARRRGGQSHAAAALQLSTPGSPRGRDPVLLLLVVVLPR
jgi:hypothetical protein